MKFVVSRTSDNYRIDDIPPCKLATKEAVNSVVRVGNTTESMTYKKWVVNIDTLEGLISFVRENGDCIITAAGEYEYPSIEIYDEYRE